MIAIDRDRARAEQAQRSARTFLAVPADRGDALTRAKEFARHGVDVVNYHGGKSRRPGRSSLAANICRDRGRIVVWEPVDLGDSRKTMYRKELSLTLSRSYGPGRYDSRYEEEGLDYPIGYVRWTEKRNMEAFLQLLASGARGCGAAHRDGVAQWSREAPPMRS